KSILVFLFSETGLIPIRYCRIGLALGFLIYLLDLPQAHLAYAALVNAFTLSDNGQPNWVNDLITALARLPIPVVCTLSGIRNSDQIKQLTTEVLHSYEASIQSSLLTHVCTHFLRNRIEYNDQDHWLLNVPIMMLRSYLSIITVPKHHHAFTRFIASSHALSIECLRYAERYHPPIPCEWRLCRFCQTGIEDECHALLICSGYSVLLYLRHCFLEDVFDKMPPLRSSYLDLSSPDFLQLILFRCRILPILAKFIYNVLLIFSGKEAWIPPPELYQPSIIGN
ncbi:hypothetical protein BT96DRAFT_815028, partial [Gymnopus androsaceus JB14]